MVDGLLNYYHFQLIHKQTINTSTKNRNNLSKNNRTTKRRENEEEVVLDNEVPAILGFQWAWKNKSKRGELQLLGWDLDFYI